MEVVKFKNRIRTQTVKMTPEGGVDTAPKREMHVQFDGMNTGERETTQIHRAQVPLRRAVDTTTAGRFVLDVHCVR